MSLRQWLAAYQFPVGQQSDASWKAFFLQFKEDLRKFWREKGVEVSW